MSHNVSMLYMYKGNHRFLFKNKLKINEKNTIKMRGEILEEHFYIYISLNLGSKVRIWEKNQLKHFLWQFNDPLAKKCPLYYLDKKQLQTKENQFKIEFNKNM